MQVKTILKNFISYYTGLVNPFPLGYVTLGITYACQSRCVMCNVWQVYQKNPEKINLELAPKIWVDALTKSRIIKELKQIAITGGEPFLKEGLNEIMLALFGLSNLKKIALFSNGFMPDRIFCVTESIMKLIAGDKTLEINIALDGYGKLHEEIRRVPRAFELVEETIEKLKILQYSYPNLRLGIVSVIQPRNIDTLNRLEEFVCGKKLPISYLVILDSYVLDNRNNAYNRYSFSALQKDKLIKLIKIYQMLGMERWIKTGKRPLRCFAGFTSMYIDAYGNMYPCVTMGNNHDFLMGNIKEKGIDEIWSSSQAFKVRKKVKHCQYTDCWGGCEIEQTLVQHRLLARITEMISLGGLNYYRLRRLI